MWPSGSHPPPHPGGHQPLSPGEGARLLESRRCHLSGCLVTATRLKIVRLPGFWTNGGDVSCQRAPSGGCVCRVRTDLHLGT